MCVGRNNVLMRVDESKGSGDADLLRGVSGEDFLLVSIELIF